MEFYEVNGFQPVGRAYSPEGVIMGKVFDMDQALKDRRYGEAIAHLNNRVDLLQATVNKLISALKK